MATVFLTVFAVNDAPPVANNDAYATSEDTALTVAAPGLMGNDTDIDNDPLTVAAPGVLGNDTDIDGDALTAVLVTGPTHGALTLNANGSFTYTPAVNFNGTDSFTYKANDGTADSGTATVTLTVTPVNDPPLPPTTPTRHRRTPR